MKKHRTEMDARELQEYWDKPVPAEGPDGRSAWVLDSSELVLARATVTPSVGSKAVCRCCGCWIPKGDTGRVRFRFQDPAARYVWRSGFLHNTCEKKTADQLLDELQSQDIESLHEEGFNEYVKEHPEEFRKSSDEPGFQLFAMPEPKKRRR